MMKLIGFCLGLCLYASVLLGTRAHAEGKEAVVVYNSSMPESKSVAEHYADRRQVPKEQVFGFELSTNNYLSCEECRDTLEKPLLDELVEMGLWRLGQTVLASTNGTTLKVEGAVLESKIRYLALCYGMPLRILPDPHLKEPVEETTRPEFRRNKAAVDTELACLPLINRKFPLTGLLRNTLYTATNAA